NALPGAGRGAVGRRGQALHPVLRPGPGQARPAAARGRRPTLEEGKRYTLVVDKGWLDANGNALAEPYRKSFRAADPVDEVIDTRLEDLAGNSVGRPFEVDVFRPVEREVKAEAVKLPFRVR